MADDSPVRVTVWISGRVQGVGMRWWIRSQALELGLCGHAANLGDGRVEVVAEGASAACTELVARLREEPSQRERPGRVSSVVVRDGAARGRESGFVER